AACTQKPTTTVGTEVASEPSTSGAETSAKSVDGAQQAPIIALMSMTIVQEDRPIARLHADGRAEGTEPDSTGKPARFVRGPTLHSDGTITLTKGGFTARVERDGKIYVVSPPRQGSREFLFGRISGHQLQLANSQESWYVRIEDDIIRFNRPGLPNRIEDVVDDQMRHTALVMVAAFFIDMSITSR
ncbi:MAG: hypothetical protein AAGC55_21890, partial [Myxococcota bacterium]